jgi:hypothetical protein
MKRCVYKLHLICFMLDALAIFSIRLKNTTDLPCASAYAFHSVRHRQPLMRTYLPRLSIIWFNRCVFYEVVLNYCLVENYFRAYI